MNSPGLILAVLLHASPHPWPHTATEPLGDAIASPKGFQRLPEEADSFGRWLRSLPIKTAGTTVRLFNGMEKGNQAAHTRVLDMDVGKKDHQQCADAVMRLRAEYLFSRDHGEAICFRATNGAPLPWTAWKSGSRPKVTGRKID